jgi:hypothetical protein
MLEAVDEIVVGLTTPLTSDPILEGHTVASASSGVRANDDLALLGEDSRVPASAPAVHPGTLGTAVDEKHQRVFLLLVKS